MSKWLGSRGEPQSNKKLKSIWMVWNLKKRLSARYGSGLDFHLFFLMAKGGFSGGLQAADARLTYNSKIIYIVRARRYSLFFYPLILILLLCHKWTFLSLSIIFQKELYKLNKKKKNNLFFSRRIPLTPFYPIEKYFYF